MATWKTVHSIHPGQALSHGLCFRSIARFHVSLDTATFQLLCVSLSLFALLFSPIQDLHAAPPPTEGSPHGLDRTEKALSKAREEHIAHPQDGVRAWQLARACYQRGDYSLNDKERERYAQEGIDAARQSLRLSNSAPAHFYLAMNLGQLARTRSLSALGLVSEMEKEFLKAIEQDARFHHAAACRSLAMLYQKAPGWPTSIGSRSKARVQFARAVELDPEYPENLLVWMEAEWRWGEKKKVLEKVTRLKGLLREWEGKVLTEEEREDVKDWKQRVEQFSQPGRSH